MYTNEKQTAEHEIVMTFIVIVTFLPSFCLYDAPMLISVYNKTLHGGRN